MVTLVLGRIICSYCSFNYANCKTAWEAVVMILSETSIIEHYMRYLLNYVFKESRSREKRQKTLLKDNSKC